ncbi:trypsin-like peptidase domain-containing protein [Candidatus Saccharibacteria bacterium]|nr:trypsin-like peptidase domain-containing protein [Candidatus Saccharibacteria bacterium]
MEQEANLTNQPKPNRRKKIALISICIIAGIWLAFGSAAFGSWLTLQLTKQSPQPVADGNRVISRDEADVSEVVQRVSKSVVSIVTTKNGRSFSYSDVRQGAGTGIIISKDGYILTNKHVVKDADRVEIVSSDGTQYTDVKFVGADPLNDVAFLKINGVNDLPAATLGDSGTVRVGQKVIAIGNSLGRYQNTVTTGIISGKGRPVQAAASKYSDAAESLTDLLQTDAAINPGNSGGPLLNMSGQVIGINTAIVSDAQSVGFAIPIAATKGLVRSVLSSGKIQKSYIGVQYIVITPEVRAEYKLPVKSGAYVGGSRNKSAVIADGPADKAGIKNGDIITKVNDKLIGEQGGLGSLISEFLPGETVELTILRDGKEQKVKLTLGAYKA